MGALALAGAVALDVWATAALARAMGPANDLFPRWFGTRAWLLQGLDPYGAAVTEGIRAAMGGAPGESLGAFVFGFVYPGYVALLLAPLALLPLTWAATVWLLLAQAATGGGGWLAWHAAGEGAGAGGRHPDAVRAPGAAGAVLVALLFPASLFNLAFGQFAALVFGALAGAWLLIGRPRTARWDALAGALLALTAVKPSLALLPAGALLLWCLAARRPWVPAGAALTGALLAGASLLALPGWPGAFLQSTADYARVASATSAAGLVATLLARLTGGTVAPLQATVAVALAATLATVAGWLLSPREPGDALGAGVLLGSWLVPPLYEWNSVLLLLPVLLWLRRRRGRAVPLATAGLLLASALTLPLLWRWPYESRALWPALVLAGWTVAAVGRYRDSGDRGTSSSTLRAGSSPSSPALT